MSGVFRREAETDFLVKADQRMLQSDSFSQMMLIMELLHEAAGKEFYAAQVFLIEKYTQWEVDPVMSIRRDAALLLLESKVKKHEAAGKASRICQSMATSSSISDPFTSSGAQHSAAVPVNDLHRLSACPPAEAQCPACSKKMRISSGTHRRNIFCVYCSHEYSVGS